MKKNVNVMGYNQRQRLHRYLKNGGNLVDYREPNGLTLEEVRIKRMERSSMYGYNKDRKLVSIFDLTEEEIANNEQSS